MEFPNSPMCLHVCSRARGYCHGNMKLQNLRHSMKGGLVGRGQGGWCLSRSVPIYRAVRLDQLNSDAGHRVEPGRIVPFLPCLNCPALTCKQPWAYDSDGKAGAESRGLLQLPRHA